MNLNEKQIRAILSCAGFETEAVIPDYPAEVEELRRLLALHPADCTCAAHAARKAKP